MGVILNLLAVTARALLPLLLIKPSSCTLTDLETKFLEVPSADGAREALKFLTSKPHVAGTPGDFEVILNYHL